MKKALKMDNKDNVATALVGLVAGDEVEVISSKEQVVQQVTARDGLPSGHKIALADIPEGDAVTKYGATIGRASKDISVGDYVHIHNVRSNRLPLTEHMLGLK
jgi:altronate dehydratase small subunit